MFLPFYIKFVKCGAQQSFILKYVSLIHSNPSTATIFSIYILNIQELHFYMNNVWQAKKLLEISMK